MKAQIFLISSWANRMAPSISSSVSSWAPASTIMTASLVPATVRFRRLFSRSSTPGFRTYFPSTKPTATEPVGPMKGASEMDRAMLEPSMAMMSGCTS